MTLFGVPGKGLDLYHIGVTVPDIHAAMEQYSASFGFTWARIRESAPEVIADGERRRVVHRVRSRRARVPEPSDLVCLAETTMGEEDLVTPGKVRVSDGWVGVQFQRVTQKRGCGRRVGH